MNTPADGLPIAEDHDADSSDPNLPAFLARPAGAPVYHGFPILDDVNVDGFRFGTITNFEATETMWGDAFIVAPDGSRAGLVWGIEGYEHFGPDQFDELLPPTEDRWGVWEVTFPFPMRTRDDARRNLQAVLPKLRSAWELWRSR
jgi:hypothetical protein